MWVMYILHQGDQMAIFQSPDKGKLLKPVTAIKTIRLGSILFGYFMLKVRAGWGSNVDLGSPPP